MKISLFCILLFCNVGEAQIMIAPVVRNIAVLAQFNNASGSGFYVRDSNFIYFATAFHVLFNFQNGQLNQDSLALISYRDDVEKDEKSILKLSLKEALRSANIKFDKQNDIAIVKIAHLEKLDTLGNFSVLYLPFARRVSYSTRINSWSLSDISIFSDITAGGDVYIIGYPKSLRLQGNLIWIVL
jgi:hypothetical protein